MSLHTGAFSFPIIVGGGFREHMRDVVRRTMIDQGTIDAADLAPA